MVKAVWAEAKWEWVVWERERERWAWVKGVWAEWEWERELEIWAEVWEWEKSPPEVRVVLAARVDRVVSLEEALLPGILLMDVT